MNKFLNKIPDYMLVILSALMLALTRYPKGFDFLAFLGIIPLLMVFSQYQKRTESPFSKYFIKKIVLNGSLFSAVFTIVALHWISIVTFPGFLGCILLFSFYYSLLFFLLMIIAKYRPKSLCLSFVLGFVSFEYLTKFGEFKFPWFNIGYGIANYLPLLQWAEFGGIYILSLFILIINVLLFMSLMQCLQTNRKKSLLYLFLAVFILLIWWGSGSFRMQSLQIQKSETTVAVVQVSIPQEIKWDPAYLDSTLYKYKSSTQLAVQNEKADLVIWPEAAVPLYLVNWSDYLLDMYKFTHELKCNLFLGFPYYEDSLKYKGQSEPQLFYNAATQLRSNYRHDNLYYKNILVPVGERMPFLDKLPFMWKLQFGQANFEPGTSHSYYQINGLTYSPLICYEIVFTDYIRQMMHQPTDFIVNITNDAWFKRTIGTHQHMVMAVYRAIETRRSVYRCANTGYSVIINPLGQITHKIGLFEKGVIADHISYVKYNTLYVTALFVLPLICTILFFIEFFLTTLQIYVKQRK